MSKIKGKNKQKTKTTTERFEVILKNEMDKFKNHLDSLNIEDKKKIRAELHRQINKRQIQISETYFKQLLPVSLKFVQNRTKKSLDPASKKYILSLSKNELDWIYEKVSIALKKDVDITAPERTMLWKLEIAARSGGYSFATHEQKQKQKQKQKRILVKAS